MRYLLNLVIKHIMLSRVLCCCAFLLAFSCSNTPPKNSLEFISKIKIAVAEPSGLVYHDKHLYVVSDKDPYLYQLQTNGLLVTTYPINSKGVEGLTYIESEEKFVLVNENKRSVFKFSIEKGRSKSYKIKGKQHSKNDGLEGICYNSKKESLFVLNEARPKQLLKISAKGKIKKKYDLSFSKDVSGIVYDPVLDVYWIVSDESKALYKVNTKGELLQEIPILVEKAEGVALDDQRNLYIVSDLTSDLFVYKLK